MSHALVIVTGEATTFDTSTPVGAVAADRSVVELLNDPVYLPGIETLCTDGMDVFALRGSVDRCRLVHTDVATGNTSGFGVDAL